MQETFENEFFEIEVLQDASAEFDAEAACTCTQDDQPAPCCCCDV